MEHANITQAQGSNPVSCRVVYVEKSCPHTLAPAVIENNSSEGFLLVYIVPKEPQTDVAASSLGVKPPYEFCIIIIIIH